MSNKFTSSNRIRRYLDAARVKDAESECVASLDFFPDENLTTGTLTVEFVKRGTYTFTDFPADEWLQFNNASSRGTYFNLYIKGNYPYTKVT
jgi:hypothetical protein